MANTEFHRLAAPVAVAILLGMVLAIQVRTQGKVQQTVQQDRVTEATLDQLVTIMREQDRLQAERDKLREVLSRNALRLQIDEQLAAGGLAQVTGAGVTVTMADPATDLASAPVSNNRVSVEDVLLVLNELRAGGAEAIAINGVRVIARTRISRQSGSSPLVVDGQVLGAPILIEAVGDPQVLASSLTMRGGVVSRLERWIQIGVHPADELAIPPLGVIPEHHHARPVP